MKSPVGPSYAPRVRLFRVLVSSVRLPMPRATSQMLETQLTRHHTAPNNQSAPRLPAGFLLAHVTQHVTETKTEQT